MHIDGDIKVWTDGDKACARLYADGPEGPIIVHASAPLGPIRRRVARAFARKGVDVSGDDPGYKATVDRLARRKALRRLAVVAPDAFKRGGLASYVARRELVKRWRRRRGQARGGKPVGAKPIGVLPKGRRKKHRRRRRFSLPRPPALRLPKALAAPMVPALAPVLAQARQAASRAIAAVPGQGGGGGGGGGSAANRASDESSAAEDEAMPDEDTDEEDATADEDQSVADDSSLDEEPEDATDDEEPDERDDDERDDEADVSGDATPAHPKHVRAAMTLLHAARRDPSARARVKRIVQLAGAGDPVAKKAVTAMKVAKDLRAAAQAPTALVKRPVSRPLALARPTAPAAMLPAAQPPSTWRRWLDVFAAWRQGIG